MDRYDLNYHFDENLHEVADNPSDMDLYVHERKSALNTVQNPLERVRILGEIGTYLRILRHLDEARDYLLKAIDVIERHSLDVRLKVSAQIRLAHVYQWQCRFEQSNPLFEELLDLARTSDMEHLNDFIWQHAGKNYFDQMKFSKARECFEKALILREARNAPEDQIESAKSSLQATLQRMN